MPLALFWEQHLHFTERYPGLYSLECDEQQTTPEHVYAEVVELAGVWGFVVVAKPE